MQTRTDVRFDIGLVGTAVIPPFLRDLSHRTQGTVLTVTDIDEIGAVARAWPTSRRRATGSSSPRRGGLDFVLPDPDTASPYLQAAHNQAEVEKNIPKFDLRPLPWGDGSRVPSSGQNLVIIGIDDNKHLCIRIFDADGTRVRDTDETKLSTTQGHLIATLKQQLPDLLPHVLTRDKKAQVITNAISLVDQTFEKAQKDYEDSYKPKLEAFERGDEVGVACLPNTGKKTLWERLEAGHVRHVPIPYAHKFRRFLALQPFYVDGKSEFELVVGLSQPLPSLDLDDVGIGNLRTCPAWASRLASSPTRRDALPSSHSRGSGSRAWRKTSTSTSRSRLPGHWSSASRRWPGAGSPKAGTPRY